MFIFFPSLSRIVEVTVEVVFLRQRFGQGRGAAGCLTGKFFFVQHYFHRPGRHIGVVEAVAQK